MPNVVMMQKEIARLQEEVKKIQESEEGRMTIKVNFKRLHPDAVLPKRATKGSVGYDLTLVEDLVLEYGVVTFGSTGWAMELPFYWVGKISPRSGLGSRGITIPNSPGTIDSDYRGELKVMLLLLTPQVPLIHLDAGTRVAQLLFQEVQVPDLIEVDELSPTLRGEGGFGSTGS